MVFIILNLIVEIKHFFFKKGKDKTIFTNYMILYLEISKESSLCQKHTHSFIRPNTSSKVTEYKINIKIVLLYTSNEQSKNIKNTMPFTIASKNKVLSNIFHKFNQRV